MNIIPDDKINEIRDKADIIDIISDYIPLTTKGKNYFGVCPFHDDHSPSMSVSRERQMFKCFTCGAGGNVFTFVSKYENISFVEAVKKVADKVGVNLNISNITSRVSKNKTELEIMDYVTRIFQNNLKSDYGTQALKYLKERNLKDEVINDFRLGFSLPDNKELSNILGKKYDLKLLDNLGLINIAGIDNYDVFTNRVMIPITDIHNNVVGFTGRLINKDTKEAKYINSKETIIYRKGNVLFNYFNALEHIKKERSVILVEGNMDAIRMYSEGIKNVVALMGTNMTSEQVKILKNLRVPVILMLDNDTAGGIATDNVGEMLARANVSLFVVRIEGSKDPDEYIVKYGVSALKDNIKHATKYFDYKLNKLKSNKNLNNTEELIEYVKNVLKMLEDKDEITREVTLRKLSDDYHLDIEVLKKELKVKKTPPQNNVVKHTFNNYQVCANNVLAYMMSDKKYVKIYNSKLGYLKEKKERNLVNEIIYYLKSHDNIKIADFISYIQNFEELKELVNEIIETMNFENLSEDIFMEYINYLKGYFKNEDIKILKQKIKNEMDINKKVELTEQLAKLKKEV